MFVNLDRQTCSFWAAHLIKVNYGTVNQWSSLLFGCWKILKELREKERKSKSN